MADSSSPFTALPKAEAQEAAPGEPRARRGFGESLGVLVLLVLAAVSGGLIAVYWPWAPDASDVNDRVAALETRVGEIAVGHAPNAAASAFQAERSDLTALKARIDADEARLDALEKTGAGPADSDIQGRVAALEKIAPPPDLGARLNSFALKADAAGLDARIAKLEARDPAAAMRRAASVLALAELVRVSESDAPFANELAAMGSLAPSPEVSDLAHYADKGVPTRAMLEERFPADSILTAERRSHAGNWLDQLWVSFSHLVSVRRIGNVKGKDTEARVARAEFDLKTGDLNAAIVELDRLKGPAHDAAAGWLADAKAREAVTRDTRALTTRVIAGLAPPQ